MDNKDTNNTSVKDFLTEQLKDTEGGGLLFLREELAKRYRRVPGKEGISYAVLNNKNSHRTPRVSNLPVAKEEILDAIAEIPGRQGGVWVVDPNGCITPEDILLSRVRSFVGGEPYNKPYAKIPKRYGVKDAWPPRILNAIPKNLKRFYDLFDVIDLPWMFTKEHTDYEPDRKALYEELWINRQTDLFYLGLCLNGSIIIPQTSRFIAVDVANELKEINKLWGLRQYIEWFDKLKWLCELLNVRFPGIRYLPERQMVLCFYEQNKDFLGLYHFGFLRDIFANVLGYCNTAKTPSDRVQSVQQIIAAWEELEDKEELGFFCETVFDALMYLPETKGFWKKYHCAPVPNDWVINPIVDYERVERFYDKFDFQRNTSTDDFRDMLQCWRKYKGLHPDIPQKIPKGDKKKCLRAYKEIYGEEYHPLTSKEKFMDALWYNKECPCVSCEYYVEPQYSYPKGVEFALPPQCTNNRVLRGVGEAARETVKKSGVYASYNPCNRLQRYFNGMPKIGRTKPYKKWKEDGFVFSGQQNPSRLVKGLRDKAGLDISGLADFTELSTDIPVDRYEEAKDGVVSDFDYETERDGNVDAKVIEDKVDTIIEDADRGTTTQKEGEHCEVCGCHAPETLVLLEPKTLFVCGDCLGIKPDYAVPTEAKDVRIIPPIYVPAAYESLQTSRHYDHRELFRLARAAKRFKGIHDREVCCIVCSMIVPECFPAKLYPIKKKGNSNHPTCCGIHKAEHEVWLNDTARVTRRGIFKDRLHIDKYSGWGGWCGLSEAKQERQAVIQESSRQMVACVRNWAARAKPSNTLPIVRTPIDRFLAYSKKEKTKDRAHGSNKKGKLVFDKSVFEFKKKLEYISPWWESVYALQRKAETMEPLDPDMVRERIAAVNRNRNPLPDPLKTSVKPLHRTAKKDFCLSSVWEDGERDIVPTPIPIITATARNGTPYYLWEIGGRRHTLYIEQTPEHMKNSVRYYAWKTNGGERPLYMEQPPDLVHEVVVERVKKEDKKKGKREYLVWCNEGSCHCHAQAANEGGAVGELVEIILDKSKWDQHNPPRLAQHILEFWRNVPCEKCRCLPGTRV